MTQIGMMNAENYKYSDVTEKIIKAFYKVYNTLGYGFLEKFIRMHCSSNLLEWGCLSKNRSRLKFFTKSRR